MTAMQKITLTRRDAERLEDLLQSVIRAFHHIIEARKHSSTETLLLDELDYDLPEMLVYEKVFELERSLPPGHWD
jgi:ATP:corrinoid adenosyltransferase